MQYNMQAEMRLELNVRIPMRDGITLSGSLYMPRASMGPQPCLFALTPYTAHRNHLRAKYFATRGYPFFVIDARGRGNSEGIFRPYIQEAADGYDIVEWIARHPCCNGKVAAFSGSYEGYSQWATAKEAPPHLATIVPGMAPALGIDFPMRNNVPYPYVMQWLALTAGRTGQDRIFEDQNYWWSLFREWFESGRPFKELDIIVGHPSPTFQEWIAHPELDEYWDKYFPTYEEFARIDLPILSLTGIYDGDQPGSLSYYRGHQHSACLEAFNKHHLVIGPWDHTGTLAPKAEFGGLKCGPAALVDILELHFKWYDWVLRGGAKPAFLKKRVAYYVMGAEEWRYAETLDETTSHCLPFFLHSVANPTDVFGSGALIGEPPATRDVDHYVYDPNDVELARMESEVDPDNYTDQRMIFARTGKQLIYHSRAFDRDTEVSGFFKLSLWLSIDQPDTDFHVLIQEVTGDGQAIRLGSDWMRARYRTSLRAGTLIQTEDPLRYHFERFLFTSRLIKQGSRLRLVIGPFSSIHSQKNYNSGGIVASESKRDARTVTVRLFHDRERPSVLYVPIGRTS